MDDGMTIDRWQQINHLFTEALELDTTEREAFLKEACQGDQELFNQVFTLLEAHDAPGPVDELQEKVMASFYAEAKTHTLAGRRIGPYEIVRELGYGGMGSVYLARRADGQFDQQVALKVLRTDVTSDQQMDRFLAERQILARLKHPNIARLLDGGITNEGQPFFVMEHIEGQPLDTFCDTHRLSIRERLALFLSVCSAVQYAHRALVVHRDLKPSNILVTEDGTVKLLDFGIAKLLDPDAFPSHPIPLTRTGLFPMTPAYASPEQVRGEAITTASDVYQLGIILYELLTGQRPYRLAGRTPSEVERIVCEEEPPRPSTAVTRAPGSDDERDTSPEAVSRARQASPDELQKRLRGELDTIVLKALRKEPERRYESPEHLAEDLRRYLEGRPVSAHPDSWRYRGRKFVSRHRWGVTVAAVIALLLIGYAATITWHSQRTQEALTQAEYEAAKSEQVTQFMMDLFEASDPAEALGDTITARALLERGVERAEQLGEQPEIQAQMFDVVGRIYGRLGRYEEAEEQLNRALALWGEIHGEDHQTTASTMVHLAVALHRSGDYEAAEPLVRQALSIQERRFDVDHPDVAVTLSMLGGILMAKGEYDEAETRLRDALQIQRTLYGADHLDMAETLNILGLLLDDKGELDAAEDALREALHIRQRLLSDRDPRVAMSLNNLAMLLRKRGDYEAAEPFYREALDVKRALYGDQHPSISVTLNGLGLLLRDKGEDDAAEPYIREALAMRRALLGDNHPRVGESLNNLGNLLESQGHLDEALSHLQEARTVLRTTLGERHPLVAYPTIGVARVLMTQNRPDEAEPLIREALSIRENALPERHPEIVQVNNMLGRCLTELGHYEEAESLLLNMHAQLAEHQERELEQETLEHLVHLYDAWDKPENAATYQAMLLGSELESQ